MPGFRERQDEEQRRAAKDLDGLRSTASGVGSALAEAANQARRHFSAADGDQTDRVDLWAKRVARVAALLFVLYLLVQVAWHLAR